MRIKDLIKLWDISYKIECNNNVSDDLINKCKGKIIRAFQEINSIDEVLSNEEMRRFCEFTNKNSICLRNGFRNYNNNDKRFHIVKN